MSALSVRARVQGKPLTLRLHPTDVFVPNLMSWFSAAQMHVRPGEVFLDVGTGSGLHAILAVKLGARLAYGTDVNPAALRLARENARLNGVGRACRFLEGSLVEPLVRRGLRVDAMIYNAPHFPARRVDPALPSRLVASVSGGAKGGDLNARFLREAPAALAPGGRIYNPVVAWADPAVSRRAVKKGGYAAHELATVHVPEWGRGNNTRAWLLERPGRHRFVFRHKPGRDTRAALQELRLDRLPPVAARKSSRVEVDFRLR